MFLLYNLHSKIRRSEITPSNKYAVCTMSRITRDKIVKRDLYVSLINISLKRDVVVNSFLINI